MAGQEKTRRSPGALTEEQAGRMLDAMNEVIRAGEEMRQLRTELIKCFADFGWTQDRIAQLTGVSQPAVSKQVARHRADDARPPMDLSLGQLDPPWLEGRLWALAEEISETLDTARCTRRVHALARGRKRFTPENVDELRRLLEADLAQHRSELPDRLQGAYDEISRGLDRPANVTATAPAGVRRALAHQIQREHFRDALRGVLRGDGPGRGSEGVQPGGQPGSLPDHDLRLP